MNPHEHNFEIVKWCGNDKVDKPCCEFDLTDRTCPFGLERDECDDLIDAKECTECGLVVFPGRGEEK